MCNYQNHINNGKQIHMSSTDKVCFGRPIFILDHAFKYKTPDGIIDIVIPEGEETDGASVPFLFWTFFPPIGRWLKTAIVHDYLYKKGVYKRSICDKVFLYDRRYAPIRMCIMWFFLKLFGWFVYYKYRLKEKTYK